LKILEFLSDNRHHIINNSKQSKSTQPLAQSICSKKSKSLHPNLQKLKFFRDQRFEDFKWHVVCTLLGFDHMLIPLQHQQDKAWWHGAINIPPQEGKTAPFTKPQ